MFLGTTPKILGQFLYSEMCKHKPERVIVPFAGNFSLEQIAKLYNPDCPVLSTDVSLYSRAIGFGAMDKEFDCKIKDSVLETFPYFKGKTSPEDIAVQVIMLTDLAANLKKNGIPYYASLNTYAIENIESMYESIMVKFRKFKANIPENFTFYGIDAHELLADVQPNDFILFDPPFFKGGYDKMFQALDECFEFTPPKYIEYDNDLILSELNSLNNKGAMVYYRTLNQLDNMESLPGFEQCYNQQYQWHNAYCVYSNVSTTPFVHHFTPLREKQPYYKLIPKDHVITENSKINFLRTDSLIANHYRMMWVHKAEMLNGGVPFLIFIDDYLIGLIQVSDGVKTSNDWACIFSDPAAPTSQYKRLSKLILYLGCTHSFLNMFNDITLWEHTGLTTRVFTNEPMSMKYRGVFNLSSRTENDKGSHKYDLIYKSKKIFNSYEEALREWLKKDGKVTH